jgi:hypothetical protein
MGFYDWDTTKSRNAYILFYERIKPEEVSVPQVTDKAL